MKNLLSHTLCILTICLAGTAQAQPTPAPDGQALPPLPLVVRVPGTSPDAAARAGIAGATVSVYREERGGAALWSEHHNLRLEAGGAYQIEAGSTRNGGFPDELLALDAAGEPLWLGVSIDGAPERERMLLRPLLASGAAAAGRTLQMVAAGPVGSLSDGRLQLWGLSGSTIWTTWKDARDPNANWTSWSVFQAPPATVTAMAVGRLTDGRLQLFAAAGSTVYTCWKETVASNASWTRWGGFRTFSSRITSIAVGSLSDGRLQVWALDSNGRLYSAWKTSTNPNADWTSWSSFGTP